jgi:AcrR family transcriptional regulator
MSNKEKIIKLATKYINDYGLESLSWRQIGIQSKIKPETVSGLFLNKEDLIQSCIEMASRQLSEFIIVVGSGFFKVNLAELWYTLVKFNCYHIQYGALINRYLKSPSLFPPTDMRPVFLKLIPQSLSEPAQDAIHCSDPIRLTAFAYLFQTAFSFSTTLDYSFDDIEPSLIKTHFYNRVQPSIDVLIKLPFF